MWPSCRSRKAAAFLIGSETDRLAAPNPAPTWLTPALLQGPAVWALRAQTDKIEYSQIMRRLLERTPNLHIREGG